ncbi:ribonuclease III [Crocinitomix algicola]|uniref:ribonuclease III n=1 Tax=Crocinitomix algicola TaxID=1740263 RepID=UPI0009F2C85E|nr:ribonuclease III [Crocinitomix algicola]
MRTKLSRVPKLFAKKRDPSEQRLVDFLEKKFNYRPIDLDLFIDALTHKSFSNTREECESNERLEYLGDTVIDLIVAHYLYDRFPNEDEGYLTKVKAKIVNRKMLAYIGGELELESYMRYRKGRSIKVATLEGNAMEALIGAMYLDSDYDTTRAVFEKYVIKKFINFKEVLSQEMDFKSLLLIWGQKNKFNISFEIIDEATKENDFIYTARVIINNKEWGMGKGTAKKEAEQNASNETMTLLGLH